MTNLERLKLELVHKDYFTDTEFRVFLEENGLDVHIPQELRIRSRGTERHSASD